LINCASFTDCEVGDLGETRSGLVDSSSSEYRDQAARVLYDCLFDDSYYTTTLEWILIMDQKRSVCVNSTHYAYQGHHSAGWTTYIGPVACAAQCYNESTASTSTRGATLGDPCTPNATGNTTDLAIVDIIPIQVIPDVDMVKDKSGYVVVNVTNTGSQAKAYVRAGFNGDELPFAGDVFEGLININNRTMENGTNELFVFNFTPSIVGTNLVVNASVEVFS
jgi:hypothetical protein